MYFQGLIATKFPSWDHGFIIVVTVDLNETVFAHLSVTPYWKLDVPLVILNKPLPTKYFQTRDNSKVCIQMNKIMHILVSLVIVVVKLKHPLVEEQSIANPIFIILLTDKLLRLLK